jgi:hypothetical protein
MPTYEFNVEAPDGSSRGTMSNQPALPERGDVLELPGNQGHIHYWQVRQRRFTPGGRVVVVVDPVT